MFYRGCCSIVHVCPSGSCFDLLMCSFPFDNGGVYSLANYSVAYEETQSNRVSDFHDVVRSLFPKAFLFDFYFCYVPRISLNLYALGLVSCIETNNKRLAGNCRCRVKRKVPTSMRKMCGFTSYCACTRSYSVVCTALLRSIVANDSCSGQRRPWSDAQSDLGLRCPLKPQTHICAWHGSIFGQCCGPL